MALLFADSFSHYATADITKKWTSNTSGTTISSTAGRRGAGGVQQSGTSNTNLIKTLASNYATLVVGFAFKTSSVDALRPIFSFRDSGTIHVTLAVTAAGALSAYRGNIAATLLGSSSNGVIVSGAENYIEIKVTISDTVGVVEVRLNGSASAVINLTSQDTRNAGNATANQIVFERSGGSGATFTWSDLYCNDTSGSTNNDFLGDTRIDCIFPNGDGNYSQFTPSTGTTHNTLVDESTPNTTDYNDGANVNDRDSYAMGNLTTLASQTVFGVQTNLAILKDDAGARSAASFVRSGSTNTDGASVALGTSQVYISQVFETDPNTSSAWTESTVNSMEAGCKVTA